MKLEIYFEERPYALETACFIVGEDQNGKRFYMKPTPIVFEHDEDLSKPIAPTFVFSGQASRQFLPALSDALIRNGYKNKDESTKHLEGHLEDMRRLVFEAYLRGKQSNET